MDIAGRVAVVTGGGTGVGAAVCARLAAAGAAGIVVNYSRSATEATATAKSLGDIAMPFQADVSHEPAVRAMIDATLKRFGRLDFLVNNAGTTRFIDFKDLDAVTDETWDAIIGVNLKGTFYCSRAAAPALRKQGGAIVNVASIAGLRAGGSSLPYGISKAGVIHLTRGLAVALAPEIRVNCVAPGAIDTRWRVRGQGGAAAQADAATEKAATPLGRIASPDDVAQPIVSFLTNDYVTGQTLVVDGGRNLA